MCNIVVHIYSFNAGLGIFGRHAVTKSTHDWSLNKDRYLIKWPRQTDSITVSYLFNLPASICPIFNILTSTAILRACLPKKKFLVSQKKLIHAVIHLFYTSNVIYTHKKKLTIPFFFKLWKTMKDFIKIKKLWKLVWRKEGSSFLKIELIGSRDWVCI